MNNAFILSDGGDGNIKITNWRLQIPQPTNDDLKKITSDQIKSMIKKKKNYKKITTE